MTADPRARAREILEPHQGGSIGSLLAFIRSIRASSYHDLGAENAVSLSREVFDESLNAVRRRNYTKLPELFAELSVVMEDHLASAVRYFHLQPLIEQAGGATRKRALLKAQQLTEHADTPELANRGVHTIWAIGYLPPNTIEFLESFLVDQIDKEDYYNATTSVLELLTSAHALDRRAARRYYFRLKSGRQSVNGHLARVIANLDLVKELDVLTRSYDQDPENWNAIFAVFELAKKHKAVAHLVLPWYLGVRDGNGLRFESNGLRAFDDRRLVDSIFTRFIDLDQSTAFDGSIRAHASFLMDCNQPNQLKAFESIGVPRSAMEALREICTSDTGSLGKFSTIEDLEKERVWDVVLRLGLPMAKEWAVESLVRELHGSSAPQMAEAIALIGADSLARIYDVNGDNGRFVLFTCEHLACRADEPFLLALLRAEGRGPTIVNSAVQQYANALARASFVTGRSDLLLDYIESGVETWRKGACAFGFRRSSRKETSPVLWDRARRIAVDPSVDDLTMGELILACAEHGGQRRGRSWISDLRPESLTGRMNVFLAEVISGAKRDGQEILAAIRDSLHELRGSQPDSRIPTIALAVAYRKGFISGQSVADILRLPKTNHGQFVFSSRGLGLDPIVGRALWDFALRWNGSNSSNPALLEGAARFDPSRLNADLLKRATKWAPNAQIGLINSIEWHGPFSKEGKVRRIVDLCLGADRKTQWHGLFIASQLSKEQMAQFVRGWLAGDEKRVRAALEAGIWLDAATWTHCVRVARRHPEGVLREYLSVLAEIREEGVLARKYLAVVSASNDFLQSYRYIQALRRLGNELTLRSLERIRATDVVRGELISELTDVIEKRLAGARTTQFRDSRLPRERD